MTTKMTIKPSCCPGRPPAAIAGAVFCALVGSVAGGTGLATTAQAQATCDWYAKTALEQQKINVDRKCGFRGEAWSSDRTSHMTWCREVSPERWKQQAQQREQQLEKCLAGK